MQNVTSFGNRSAFAGTIPVVFGEFVPATPQVISIDGGGVSGVPDPGNSVNSVGGVSSVTRGGRGSSIGSSRGGSRVGC